MLRPEIGNIPDIITNGDSLYDGDLTHYLRVVFFQSSNLDNPYHNLRHTLHVTWLCYKACEYYRSELTPRQMRILLIAALFHDFDHPGRPHPGEEDPDRINIALAIAGIRRHIAPEDRTALPEIEELIEATHYPYKTPGEALQLSGKIIRDADLAQVLGAVWIQHVIIGLAREWGVEPLAVLKAQGSFLRALPFNTRWARELFPEALVEAKIEEAGRLLGLLTG